MPDVTPELQALIDASTALIASCAVLVDDNQQMAQADGDYDQAAKQRNEAARLFNDANTAFVANPADAQALAAFEAAVQSLLDLSRTVSRLRSVKDAADKADSDAVADYNSRLADVRAKFDAFIAANTP